MRGIYPYDKQEIIIDVPKDVFLAEFAKQVNLSLIDKFPPIFWHLWKSGTHRFAGEIVSEEWKIFLISNYKNSFKPQICMKAFPEGEKTRIIFEFKVHIAAKIFMSFFHSICLFAFIYEICNHSDAEVYFTPVGLFLGSFLFLYMGFYMSLDHSAEALNEVLTKIQNDYEKPESASELKLLD